MLDDNINKLEQELEDLQRKILRYRDAAPDIDEKAEEYREMARRKAKEMWFKAKYAGKKMDEHAHKYPYVWMGAGVALGMILGLMAAMKSKRE